VWLRKVSAVSRARMWMPPSSRCSPTALPPGASPPWTSSCGGASPRPSRPVRCRRRFRHADADRRHQELGELAGPSELPRLLDLLGKATTPEDLEATEQALSAAGLKATDPVSCVAQVEARLAQAPPTQKCALIRVLGSAGGTNALKAVRAAVNDPNTEVHAAAIRTLGAGARPTPRPTCLTWPRAPATRPTR